MAFTETLVRPKSVPVNELPDQTSFQNVNHAFILSPGGTFCYKERPTPKIESERDVIVRVVATGLCGSDVHYWQHGRIGRYAVNRPIVLGHESSGVIVACGSNVDGLKVGDRVALEPGISCNTCKYCRSGHYNLCKSMVFAATPPYDGTLSTFYKVPAECCYKLPVHISLRDGALVEPLSVAVHACRLAGDMQNKSVVVFGAGPVGLLCCSVASAFGAAKVVAVDVVKTRLATATKYGATHRYEMDAEKKNAEELSATAALEDGADIILDATGAEPCLNCGLDILRSGGTFVQVGLGNPTLMFPVGQVCDKEVVFKGSFRYGPGDYALAIGLLESRRVQLDGMVTHEFSFWKAHEAFQNVVHRQGIKCIIYGPGIDEEWARIAD
ncbi:hypothetical protein KXV92_004239 [Aspergillus fumigatus]|nr:hypothetical protein KXX42_004300 [Aspergillus fumigatus]KAH1549652.1 hypothetical protein KXX57_000705 [Aspergillus fumigatus]KAH2310279.1 hypothetical protein KXV47_005288 [Aspergillus fumigatus]KAH2676046.1 hypothetical protein KXV32_000122 [Aspergillus fumigatus]KAH2769265.1 hypothetical protein KXV94_008618 [Aspergillus fumigatus]